MRFLRSEEGTYFKNLLKIQDQLLFVQLGALRQKGLSFEIRHWEEGSTSLCGGNYNSRRIHLHEAVFGQETSRRL